MLDWSRSCIIRSPPRPASSPASAAALEISERRALAAARAVVVTSRATAATLLAGYGVTADRMTVIEPGTDPRLAPNRSAGL